MSKRATSRRSIVFVSKDDGIVVWSDEVDAVRRILARLVKAKKRKKQ